MMMENLIQYGLEDWFAFGAYGIILGFGTSLLIYFMSWCVYAMWEFFKNIIK